MKKEREVIWVTTPEVENGFRRPGIYTAPSTTPGYGAVRSAIVAGAGEDMGQRDVVQVVASVLTPAPADPSTMVVSADVVGPIDWVVEQLEMSGHQIPAREVREAIVEQGRRRYTCRTEKSTVVFSDAGTISLVAMRVHGGRAANPEGGELRKVKFEFGREFFINKRRQYGDWRMGWWREAIQNAVDAGATEIVCSVNRCPDGNIAVSLEDNGRGMTETVLVEKFLRGGGTTKVGEGVAGGFGSAKELLILPWLGYTIETRGVVARGVMDEITIEKASVPRAAGVKLTVIMPPDDHTTLGNAATFIQKCYLPRVRFMMEGTDQVPYEVKAELKRGKIVERIANEAELYAPKVDYDANYVFVRVNGLFMFSRWIYGGGKLRRQPIIEVTAPSVDVFTDNRDGFRSDTELPQKIDELVSNIAVEAERAFKKKSGIFRDVYKGIGTYKTEVERREADVLWAMGEVIPVAPRPDGTGQKAVLTEQGLMQIMHVLDTARHNSGLDSFPDGELASKMIAGTPFQGPNHVSRAMKQLVWEPDFLLVNEVEGFRVPKKFRPETMSPRVYKLVKVWGELCRYVLMQLDSDEEYGIGLMFSEDTAAAYSRESQRHWLLLNPMTHVNPAHGTQIFKPSSYDHLKILYALAVHEATHMVDKVSEHNVEFAYALTRNIALTGDGFRKLRSIASSIKTHDRPRLELRSSR